MASGRRAQLPFARHRGATRKRVNPLLRNATSGSKWINTCCSIRCAVRLPSNRLRLNFVGGVIFRAKRWAKSCSTRCYFSRTWCNDCANPWPLALAQRASPVQERCLQKSRMAISMVSTWRRARPRLERRTRDVQLGNQIVAW